MKRANEVIPDIISAKTHTEAVAALNKTLQLLNLTSDYLTLNMLKTDLEGFEKEFAVLENRYRELNTPRSYEDVHEIRLELNFLYRDASDKLAFDISKNKVYFEERKSVFRATSMLELSENEEFQGKIKATSASALRDVYGASDSMKQFSNLYSLAYGLFRNFDTFLNGVKMTSDSISSEERYILNILQKDVK